jgi:hypothetical protein
MKTTTRMKYFRYPHHRCDFCEERVTDRFIYQSENGLFLCSDCVSYLERLPDCIEKAIERFLLVNVV